MLLNEKIQAYLRKLPPSFQAEALDFIEYLLARAEVNQKEESEWNTLSLTNAMSDMATEESAYSISDLKVIFR
jgi:hypothetical protein